MPTQKKSVIPIIEISPESILRAFVLWRVGSERRERPKIEYFFFFFAN
jgi:hypothetical protein